MMPALQKSTSSRDEAVVNCAAAARTEVSDERSHSMKVILLPMEETSEEALAALRPVK